MTWYSDDEVIYCGDCALSTVNGSYLHEAIQISISLGGTFVTFTTATTNTNYNVSVSKCYNSSGESVGCDVPEAGKLTSGFWAYPTENATLQIEVFIR